MSPKPTAKKIIANAKKLSIDCDGTIMTFFLGRGWLKREKTTKDKNTGLLQSLLGKLEDQWMNLIQTFRPPTPNALKTLSAWKSRNKKLYFLTSRHPQIIPSSEKWLQKHRLSSLFEKKHFNLKKETPWVHKEKVIRQENIDLHLDDDPKTIRYLAQALPTKFFIYLSREKNPINYPNVLTFNSWSEIDKNL
jgi:hypothetical protein